MTPQELKKKHDEYNRIRLKDGWKPVEAIVLYDFDELVLHLLLESEVFYVKNEKTMNHALTYLQSAYKCATFDDLERVYRQYRDLVTEVYG